MDRKESWVSAHKSLWTTPPPAPREELLLDNDTINNNSSNNNGKTAHFTDPYAAPESALQRPSLAHLAPCSSSSPQTSQQRTRTATSLDLLSQAILTACCAPNASSSSSALRRSSHFVSEANEQKQCGRRPAAIIHAALLRQIHAALEDGAVAAHTKNLLAAIIALSERRGHDDDDDDGENDADREGGEGGEEEEEEDEGEEEVAGTLEHCERIARRVAEQLAGRTADFTPRTTSTREVSGSTRRRRRRREGRGAESGLAPTLRTLEEQLCAIQDATDRCRAAAETLLEQCLIDRGAQATTPHTRDEGDPAMTMTAASSSSSSLLAVLRSVQTQALQTWRVTSRTSDTDEADYEALVEQLAELLDGVSLDAQAIPATASTVLCETNDEMGALRLTGQRQRDAEKILARVAQLVRRVAAAQAAWAKQSASLRLYERRVGRLFAFYGESAPPRLSDREEGEDEDEEEYEEDAKDEAPRRATAPHARTTRAAAATRAMWLQAALDELQRAVEHSTRGGLGMTRRRRHRPSGDAGRERPCLTADAERSRGCIRALLHAAAEQLLRQGRQEEEEEDEEKEEEGAQRRPGMNALSAHAMHPQEDADSADDGRPHRASEAAAMQAITAGSTATNDRSTSNDELAGQMVQAMLRCMPLALKMQLGLRTASSGGSGQDVPLHAAEGGRLVDFFQRLLRVYLARTAHAHRLDAMAAQLTHGFGLHEEEIGEKEDEEDDEEEGGGSGRGRGRTASPTQGGTAQGTATREAAAMERLERLVRDAVAAHAAVQTWVAQHEPSLTRAAAMEQEMQYAVRTLTPVLFLLLPSASALPCGEERGAHAAALSAQPYTVPSATTAGALLQTPAAGREEREGEEGRASYAPPQLHIPSASSALPLFTHEGSGQREALTGGAQDAVHAALSSSPPPPSMRQPSPYSLTALVDLIAAQAHTRGQELRRSARQGQLSRAQFMRLREAVALALRQGRLIVQEIHRALRATQEALLCYTNNNNDDDDDDLSKNNIDRKRRAEYEGSREEEDDDAGAAGAGGHAEANAEHDPLYGNADETEDVTRALHDISRLTAAHNNNNDNNNNNHNTRNDRTLSEATMGANERTNDGSHVVVALESALHTFVEQLRVVQERQRRLSRSAQAAQHRLERLTRARTLEGRQARRRAMAVRAIADVLGISAERESPSGALPSSSTVLISSSSPAPALATGGGGGGRRSFVSAAANVARTNNNNSSGSSSSTPFDLGRAAEKEEQTVQLLLKQILTRVRGRSSTTTTMGGSGSGSYDASNGSEKDGAASDVVLAAEKVEKRSERHDEAGGQHKVRNAEAPQGAAITTTTLPPPLPPPATATLSMNTAPAAKAYTTSRAERAAFGVALRRVLQHLAMDGQVIKHVLYNVGTDESAQDELLDEILAEMKKDMNNNNKNNNSYGKSAGKDDAANANDDDDDEDDNEAAAHKTEATLAQLLQKYTRWAGRLGEATDDHLQLQQRLLRYMNVIHRFFVTTGQARRSSSSLSSGVPREVGEEPAGVGGREGAEEGKEEEEDRAANTGTAKASHTPAAAPSSSLAAATAAIRMKDVVKADIPDNLVDLDHRLLSCAEEILPAVEQAVRLSEANATGASRRGRKGAGGSLGLHGIELPPLPPASPSGATSLKEETRGRGEQGEEKEENAVSSCSASAAEDSKAQARVLPLSPSHNLLDPTLGQLYESVAAIYRTLDTLRRVHYLAIPVAAQSRGRSRRANAEGEEKPKSTNTKTNDGPNAREGTKNDNNEEEEEEEEELLYCADVDLVFEDELDPASTEHTMESLLAREMQCGRGSNDHSATSSLSRARDEDKEGEGESSLGRGFVSLDLGKLRALAAQQGDPLSESEPTASTAGHTQGSVKFARETTPPDPQEAPPARTSPSASAPTSELTRATMSRDACNAVVLRVTRHNARHVQELLRRFSANYKSAAILIQKDNDAMQQTLCAMLEKYSELDVEAAFGQDRRALKAVYDVMHDKGSTQKGCYFFSRANGEGGCPWVRALRLLSVGFEAVVEKLVQRTDTVMRQRDLLADLNDLCAMYINWAQQGSSPRERCVPEEIRAACIYAEEEEEDDNINNNNNNKTHTNEKDEGEAAQRQAETRTGLPPLKPRSSALPTSTTRTSSGSDRNKSEDAGVDTRAGAVTTTTTTKEKKATEGEEEQTRAGLREGAVVAGFTRDEVLLKVVAHMFKLAHSLLSRNTDTNTNNEEERGETVTKANEQNPAVEEEGTQRDESAAALRQRVRELHEAVELAERRTLRAEAALQAATQARDLALSEAAIARSLRRRDRAMRSVNRYNDINPIVSDEDEEDEEEAARRAGERRPLHSSSPQDDEKEEEEKEEQEDCAKNCNNSNNTQAQTMPRSEDRHGTRDTSACYSNSSRRAANVPGAVPNNSAGRELTGPAIPDVLRYLATLNEELQFAYRTTHEPSAMPLTTPVSSPSQPAAAAAANVMNRKGNSAERERQTFPAALPAAPQLTRPTNSNTAMSLHPPYYFNLPRSSSALRAGRTGAEAYSSASGNNLSNKREGEVERNAHNQRQQKEEEEEENVGVELMQTAEAGSYTRRAARMGSDNVLPLTQGPGVDEGVLRNLARPGRIERRTSRGRRITSTGAQGGTFPSSALTQAMASTVASRAKAARPAGHEGEALANDLPQAANNHTNSSNTTRSLSARSPLRDLPYALASQRTLSTLPQSQACGARADQPGQYRTIFAGNDTRVAELLVNRDDDVYYNDDEDDERENIMLRGRAGRRRPTAFSHRPRYNELTPVRKDNYRDEVVDEGEACVREAGQRRPGRSYHSTHQQQQQPHHRYSPPHQTTTEDTEEEDEEENGRRSEGRQEMRRSLATRQGHTPTHRVRRTPFASSVSSLPARCPHGMYKPHAFASPSSSPLPTTSASSPYSSSSFFPLCKTLGKATRTPTATAAGRSSSRVVRFRSPAASSSSSSSSSLRRHTSSGKEDDAYRRRREGEGRRRTQYVSHTPTRRHASGTHRERRTLRVAKSYKEDGEYEKEGEDDENGDVPPRERVRRSSSVRREALRRLAAAIARHPPGKEYTTSLSRKGAAREGRGRG